MAPKTTKRKSAASGGKSEAAAAPVKKAKASPPKAATTVEGATSALSVTIEHWSGKVEKALKQAGIAVSVNPEKPRKGCFEVKDSSGKVWISLLDMPRPFTNLKAVDFDELANQIVEGLNSRSAEPAKASSA